MFHAPENIIGIGDDCSVIPQGDGLTDTLVSTDLLIEDVHFMLGSISPRDLGWKSAAVNFSDIAAMGGTPEASFLGLAIPAAADSSFVLDFMDGYKELSDILCAPLLGGDTSLSPDRLCISVTVMGRCAHGSAVLRSGAKTGDLICTTGCLGDSAAGLKILLENPPAGPYDPFLVGRHHHPVPRVQEGRLLSASGVSAMMDISDGVASDLRHILNASNKGARVFTDRLPLSRELSECCRSRNWDILQLALCGGEDYELLFTISPDSEKRLGLEHYVIGEITESPGIEWEGTSRDFTGFRHF